MHFSYETVPQKKAATAVWVRVLTWFSLQLHEETEANERTSFLPITVKAYLGRLEDDDTFMASDLKAVISYLNFSVRQKIKKVQGARKVFLVT